MYAGKALVLGSDTRALLATIRSLGRKNILIHVGWCKPDCPALKSKYIAEILTIPAFTPTEHWKNEMLRILQGQRYDVVMPVNDASILPLQFYQDTFEKASKLGLPTCHPHTPPNDKFVMQALASQLGIATPREFKVSRSDNAGDVASQLGLPVVLKPRFSFEIGSLNRKNMVVKAFSEEQLQYYLRGIPDGGQLAAQENFIGRGIGVSVLAHTGTLLYAFQHLRLHEPTTGGGSSYRRSMPIDATLYEACAKLMKALNYSGVAMVEFKMDLASGKWIFIELNPRFWGSLPLAVSCGADFPFYLYSMLVHGRTSFSNGYQSRVYCRNLMIDTAWFRNNIKANRSDPRLETVPLWRLAGEVLHILMLRERNDALTLDDIEPGIAEIKSILSGVLWTIRKRIDRTCIMRRRQATVAARQIEKAITFLFICKGNICRSPFAAYYLAARLPNKYCVKSCGFYPQAGRPCPLEAQQAGLKFEVGMSSHRSNVVTRGMIERADVIFTFDELGFRTIRRRFPFAKRRIMRLSALDVSSPFEIADPINKNSRAYSGCYEEIRRLLDSIEVRQENPGMPGIRSLAV